MNTIMSLAQADLFPVFFSYISVGKVEEYGNWGGEGGSKHHLLLRLQFQGRLAISLLLSG